MSAIEDLRGRLGEIGDLSRAAALLAWDERTMMPPAGGEARSEQLATLAKVRHEMFCDDEVGRLLEAAGAEVGEAEPGEASEPASTPTWSASSAATGPRPAACPPSSEPRWRAPDRRASRRGSRRRSASDYSILLPHLERNVELTRRYADCYEGFPGFSHPYDPLLDEYEPEMTTEQMRAVLGELREGLVPLVAEAHRGDGERLSFAASSTRPPSAS